MNKNNTTHIHFIGICGVAMSALAIAFHERGYRVTGSDKGFYPPVSTNLEHTGIEFYPGWHPEKMGNPDLVVVGNVAGSQNPEWQYVQKNKIAYKSYPEVIQEFFITDTSIVCAGTYGKTTSTTLLSWIFTYAGKDPNYMFGGISANHIPPAKLGETHTYSIIEGDEYKASRWDMGAKFFYYKPTHLLLTAVEWDHADIYPTEANYIEAFQKLLDSLPKTGQLVMSDTIQKDLSLPECTTLRYGKTKDADYQYSDVAITKNGITFSLHHDDEIYIIACPLLGRYSADNITGCFAIADSLGITPKTIIEAVTSFKGIKRRLERRHSGAIDIYDDIAHSPSKATSALTALRELYSQKIIAIYEPNTGNRKPSSFPGYAQAFAAADEIIIPRLSRIKLAKDDPDPPVGGQKLTEIIAHTHTNVQYMPNDDELIEYLLKNTTSGDCIVFLGSHGFRNMIEEMCKKIM